MTRHTKNRNVTLLVQYKQVIKFNVGQYRVLISHMRGLSPILRNREKEYIYIKAKVMYLIDIKFFIIPIL